MLCCYRREREGRIAGRWRAAAVDRARHLSSPAVNKRDGSVVSCAAVSASTCPVQVDRKRVLILAAKNAQSGQLRQLRSENS
jgi:hypothetical protein